MEDSAGYPSGIKQKILSGKLDTANRRDGTYAPFSNLRLARTPLIHFSTTTAKRYL